MRLDLTCKLEYKGNLICSLNITPLMPRGVVVMSPLSALLLILLLTMPEGIVHGDQTLNLRCQCIVKESRRIGRYLGKVEVHPPNSNCEETEIIATLKKDGQRICLDPNAQWVKKILSRNPKSKHYKSSTNG